MRGGQYASGQQGERLAESYLSGLGMLCLARNYRGLDGEIDLVMQDGDTLVMVEVKYMFGLLFCQHFKELAGKVKDGVHRGQDQ